ncbi:uncharacterized protein [Bemisia tabaci]|uniref:uncharacterized protein n=1 Tax=Bemisia tabaci TaxID=7038 RepID=UPI003B285A23
MKPAEQYNYSLASSAVPLSNECKSISRQSLYRDKENADDRCLQAFAFLDQARYNVCNGYSEAKCRFIPLPSSTSTSCGTYLCTAVVSNVIKSFEDCAPALGLPTFGEGSTSSTGGDGSSRLLCFASAKRLQIGEVGKKRRVSPPPPFPTLNSSWGAQSFGSSSVKRSNTRPTYAGPTSQGISSIPPPPPAIMDPSWGPQTFAGSSSVKRADYPSRYTYPTTQGGESQERTPFQCYKCKKYYKTQAILELHFRTHKEGQSSSRRTSPPGGQSSSRRTSPPGGQSSSRRTSPPGGQYPQDPSGLIQDPTFGVADLDGADSQYTMFFQPGTSQTGSEAGHFRGSSGLDEAGMYCSRDIEETRKHRKYSERSKSAPPPKKKMWYEVVNTVRV